MSGLAEVLRGQTLMRQANAAKAEAEQFAASFHLAWGLGGEPAPEAVARYDAACERAERLYLEASLAGGPQDAVAERP